MRGATGLGTLTFLALTAGSALAEVQLSNMTYHCDRDVQVPAVYVNDPDTSAVVLYVDGSQVLLYAEPAASGVRYGWPSDGSSYVWWTKGDEATLFWKDGDTGTETVILGNCLSG